MTLTNSQQLRLRINDKLRYGQEVRGGDGLAATFQLAQGAPFSTVTAASAYLSAAGGWSATGATFNADLGLVAFQSAISANTAFRVDYQWSVFSEDEITQLLADGVTIAGAALGAVKTLMFDSLRRSRWAAPDGTQYDDTAAMGQLTKMYDQLHEEARESPEGGIESWSQNQKNYSSDYFA